MAETTFWDRVGRALTSGESLQTQSELARQQAVLEARGQAASHGRQLLAQALEQAGPDPVARAGAVSNFVRQIFSDPALSADPELIPQLLQEANAVKEMMAQPQRELPRIEEVREGNEQVTYERDPVTGQRREIARGPAWAPQTPSVVFEAGAFSPAAQENPWTKRGMDRVTELDTELGTAQRVMLNLDAAREAIKAGAVTGLGGLPKIGFQTPLGHFGLDLGPDFIASLIPLGHAVGIVDAETKSQTELLQSITAQLAPLMRPVGSGSTSDRDLELYLQAVPSLAKSARGNMLIIDLMEKGVRHKQQQLALLEAMIESGTYSPSRFSTEVSKLDRPFSEDELETLEIIARGKPQKFEQAAAKVDKPGSLSADDIARMTPREIALVDVSKLSAEQRQALISRMMQLGM